MRPSTEAKRRSDALEAIRAKLTPPAPQTLEQQLDALSESELTQLQQTARLVQMSAGFSLTLNGQTESYANLIRSMYPAMSAQRRALLIELLNDVAPIPEIQIKATTSKASGATAGQRTQAHDSVHAEYASLVPSQPSESQTGVAQQPAAQQAERPIQGTTPRQTTRRTGSADDFMQRLVMSESSGDPNAEITIQDSRRFVGRLQFGEARLKDYQAATGKSFTQDEFQANEALQDEVAQWHFKDIDKAIDALGDEAKGYDRDGLRSIAHLGGKGGMKRFVRSDGAYNPSDELGTSLSDYYGKFSTKGDDT